MVRSNTAAASLVFVLGFSLAPIANSQAPGNTLACQWVTPAQTFDLSPMTALGSVYGSVDTRNTYLKYFYNFCTATNPPPGVSGCTGSTPALAWQSDTTPKNGKPLCYRMGWNAPNGWSFGLSDPKKPAFGVVMKYSGGDNSFCPETKPGQIRFNRTFSIDVQCAPVAAGPASHTSESVFETNTCDYRITLKSITGCPTACISGPASICSNNGNCGYDTDAQVSRCFCNTGFTGAVCATASASSNGTSAETVILILVCIILAFVLGLVAFMFFKLRKLQVDPSAYGQLEGKFNELGMLA